MTRRTTTVVVLAVVLVAPATRADEVPDALGVEWNGHKPCEKLDEDANIRVLRCVFEPGDKHLKHWHPAAFGYALSGGHGQVEDSKGIREVDVKEGAYSITPPIPWHEFTNTGVTTIQYIIVEKKYAPPPRPQ